MTQLIAQRPNADTFAEYAANPDAFLSIKGVPPEIAARLPGFADFSIDGDQLVQAVREAGPQMGPATPGWAVKIMRHGVAGLALGDLGEAFRRLVLAYLRAARHFASGLEVLKIPFEGSTLTAYLRLPPGTSQTGWPLVVIWGGIDVWKSDLEVHSQSEALLKAGIATLSVDMPGTGECPIPVSANAERVLLAAMDAICQHESIDEARLGCYGLSFGGHWAVKVALLRSGLLGVDNNAGPVHHTFQPEWVQTLPMGTRMALSRVMGLDLRGQPQALLARLSELSLVKQGLLPTSLHAPLLSLNGEQDELVPIVDLEVTHQNGVRQDRLIFAHDRHVASRLVATRTVHGALVRTTNGESRVVLVQDWEELGTVQRKIQTGWCFSQ